MPELAAVLAELVAREPIFHRPEFGTTRADFDRMMASDFWEIGASGKMYDRAFVLDLLEKRHKTPQEENLQAFDFQIRELAPGAYLLHYSLLQEQRKTVWERSPQGSKVVFHQGTLVP